MQCFQYNYKQNFKNMFWFHYLYDTFNKYIQKKFKISYIKSIEGLLTIIKQFFNKRILCFFNCWFKEAINSFLVCTRLLIKMLKENNWNSWQL